MTTPAPKCPPRPLAATLRPVLPETTLVLGAILLVWTVIALHLFGLRDSTITQARHMAANLALAYQQNVTRTIDNIDQTIAAVRDDYAADPTGFDLTTWSRAHPNLNRLSFQISFISRDGQLWMTNFTAAHLGLDLSDRDHFRVPMRDTQDRLFASRPVRGRVSQKIGIQFARRLFGPGHRLDGVVVVSVDRQRLTQFEAVLDSGSVFLLGGDGVLRAASARLPILGADSAPRLAGLAAPPDQAGATFFAQSPQGTMLIGLRRLPGEAQYSEPLYAGIAFAKSDILRPYHAALRAYLLVGLLLSLMLGAFGLWLVRLKRGLLRSRAVLHVAIENIDQGLILFDAQGRVPMFNRRATELLGVAPGKTRSRAVLADLLRWRQQPGARQAGARLGGTHPFRGHAPSWPDASTDGVAQQVLANGTVLELRTRALADGGAVRTLTDITEATRAAEHSHFLALHDPLTGLANRHAITAAVDAAIVDATVDPAQPGLALLYLDLDWFKLVNDTRGHHVGDQLLAAVAARLRQTLRAQDILGRIGGDEFMVLHVETPQGATGSDVARRLIEAIGTPFEIDGQSLALGASIGIASFPADGDSFDTLARHADMALYQAKKLGRGRACRYTAQMNSGQQEAALLERDLRGAVERGEIHMEYQPICETGTGNVIRFEALMRWTHPELGPISPARFIPVAEQSGQIVELGLAALAQACAAAVGWPDEVQISVNLSPAQFWQTDLAAQIDAILARTGLDAARLTLEITEGLLIEESERALAVMQTLRARGIRFALDDFGTGHAGLNYLRQFPFQTIKIDKVFVQTLGQDPSTLAIVQAILGLGRSLGLEVVAEGVETQAQLEWLRRLRCRLVQGYLTGRPTRLVSLRGLRAAGIAANIVPAGPGAEVSHALFG